MQPCILELLSPPCLQKLSKAPTSEQPTKHIFSQLDCGKRDTNVKILLPFLSISSISFNLIFVWSLNDIKPLHPLFKTIKTKTRCQDQSPYSNLETSLKPESCLSLKLQWWNSIFDFLQIKKIQRTEHILFLWPFSN